MKEIIVIQALSTGVWQIQLLQQTPQGTKQGRVKQCRI